MKNTFKQILIEFEAFDIPVGIPRAFTIPSLPPTVRKAMTFIGMRRSGKTWVMYQHMRHLLSEGVPRDQMLYVNFEDERLRGIDAKDLQSILDAYFELNPQHEKSDRIFLYFDEIQVVPGWEKFIRRLLDAMQFQIYLTGSSAKLLSKEIATELRGRSLTREIFPFHFSEYLTAQLVTVDSQKITQKKKSILLHYLHLFLKYGGFPEVIGLSDWTHREILQNYIQVVIYRDIIERYQVSNILSLEKFTTHLLQNPASKLSINKVFAHFKSLGFQISKNSLYEWLDYLEDAYCIFAVGCFNGSSRKASLKPKKIYPIDTGLITAFAILPDMKLGQLLETAVFRHLKEKPGSLYYYETINGFEIDFLVQTVEGKISLIQVCLSLSEEQTIAREIRALSQAMEELDLKRSVIVTLEEERVISEKNKTIDVIPLWKLLLS